MLSSVVSISVSIGVMSLIVVSSSVLIGLSVENCVVVALSVVVSSSCLGGLLLLLSVSTCAFVSSSSSVVFALCPVSSVVPAVTLPLWGVLVPNVVVLVNFCSSSSSSGNFDISPLRSFMISAPRVCAVLVLSLVLPWMFAAVVWYLVAAVVPLWCVVMSLTLTGCFAVFALGLPPAAVVNLVNGCLVIVMLLVLTC